MKPFKIKFLDHVAIRSADVEASAAWYEKLLGLKRMDVPEWDNFPVFMAAGKTGVAIFPANQNDPKNDIHSKNTGIVHFAFNVSNEDFHKAREYFTELGEDFTFQDHTYFHSLYLKDPDGHKVELTTMVVDEDRFYL
jgi:catechol 2,3-dioxygenase-like lactoylglutathione lyase family enzyme